VVVLLWHVDVQQPVHGLHVCLNWINFFWQNMDGKHVWLVIPFADMSGMTAKNNQAVSCQAQNSGHLRISRALNKKAKLGSVPIKVITQEFLLRGRPVVQVKAMLAATPLKNLVGTSGDCRPDNLLMLLPATLDRNHPVGCYAFWPASPFSHLPLHSFLTPYFPERSVVQFLIVGALIGSGKADKLYRRIGWLC
jgi:hypothetical protein